MKTVRLSLILAICISVAGFFAARSADAAAAPDNHGVPGQIIKLQDTVNVLHKILKGIQADVANIIGEVSGLQLTCTTPDLVPVPQTGFDIGNPFGFCRFDAQGRLVVRVRNQGGVSSGPSKLRVTFGTLGGPVAVVTDTPPLAAFGGFVDLTMDVPAGCFVADCAFSILADEGLVVTESDEINNSANGLCLG